MNPRSKAMLAILGAILLWSTSYVVTKVGVSDMPPLTFGAIRFVVASAVCLIFRALGKVQPVARKDLGLLCVAGLLGITAYFSLQNLGVQLSTAADATLLVASFPAVTTVLEMVLFRRRSRWTQFAGIAVAFVGVFIVVRQGMGAAASNRLLGDLLLLGTGVAWAFYNFATRGVVQRYSVMTVVFWQTIFGTLAFLPLSLLEMRSWHVPGLPGLAGVLFLGTLCSVAAFVLYARGLVSLEPSVAVGLLNLVPLFGVLAAWAFLGEAITPAQIIGGVVVVAGVAFIAAREPARATERQPSPGCPPEQNAPGSRV